MARILVVDDLPDVRLSLCMMLEASGFEVAEAADGAAALSELGRQQVDVVLTDLFMPGVNGIGLIKALTREPRRPVIIAMTGHADLNGGAEHRMALELADAVLIKPFGIQDLLNTIKTIGRTRSTPESERR